MVEDTKKKEETMRYESEVTQSFKCDEEGEYARKRTQFDVHDGQLVIVQDYGSTEVFEIINIGRDEADALFRACETLRYNLSVGN